MKKRTVLIFMGRYLPGFKDGGPVRTILNLVNTFYDEYNFKIVTNDRDHNDTKPYPNIVPNLWNDVGNAKVYYVPPKGFSYSLLIKLAKNADIIYCCGPYNIYSIKSMILKKLKFIKSPVVIASMGSFSPGAYKIKGIKKRVFINLLKFTGLFKSILWSVTSIIEKKEVQKEIGKNAICFIAEDLPRKNPKHFKVRCKKPGKLKIVFISRISKMKNLEYAIEIISKLKDSIDFVIYGNIEDEFYWDKCLHLLKSLPSNITWKYEGEADSESIIDIFSEYDIFLFPTLGENYGHVIYESLAAGCVPVISDKTPWQDFNKKNCGNVIPLNDFEKFIDTLEKYVNMSENDFKKLSNNAHEYAKEKYSKAVTYSGYNKIFNDI